MNAKTLKRILRSLKGKSFKDFCGDQWTIMCVNSDGFQKDPDTGTNRQLLALNVRCKKEERVFEFPLSNELKKALETGDVAIELYEICKEDPNERYHWGIRAKHLGEHILENL